MGAGRQEVCLHSRRGPGCTLWAEGETVRSEHINWKSGPPNTRQATVTLQHRALRPHLLR